jgi:hypothetical protein
VLYATGTFGSNIAPAWIDDRPGVVLALSSRNRNLLLARAQPDAIPYAVIGFLRLFVVGMVLYYVGAWFGPASSRGRSRRSVSCRRSTAGSRPASTAPAGRS